jgi:sensor histidine kinase regulating citrate/malate metabolism
MKVLKKGFFDSLKTQIIFFVIIAIALSTGIVASVIIYFNYQSTYNQMKMDGISLARSNAYIIAEKAEDGQPLSEIQSVVKELDDSQKLEYLSIFDNNGIDVADDEDEYLGESYADDADTMNVAKNNVEIAGFWTEDGNKVLDVMVPLNATIDGKELAVMDIGISVDNLDGILVNSIIKNILISILSIILFSFATAIFVDKKISSLFRAQVAR